MRTNALPAFTMTYGTTKTSEELKDILRNIVPPGKTKPLYFLCATNAWLAQVVLGDEWTTVYTSQTLLSDKLKRRWSLKSWQLIEP